MKKRADAIIAPIPKKGSLQHDDNCRGICLLDVVGKTVAGILKFRLAVFA